MAGQNGVNPNNGTGGSVLPVLRIARPAEGSVPAAVTGETEVSAALARAESARKPRTARAEETPVRADGKPASTTTRVTKRQKAEQTAKNLVLTLNTGATLVAGPGAAMQKSEHDLIETGMVSLANQYPDKFVAGGNALGPGMLAIGCFLWIGRIIREQRAAESAPKAPPPVAPLAENWRGQTATAGQPEWEPSPAPAVLTETPVPNGQQYEGGSHYDWVRQYTALS